MSGILGTTGLGGIVPGSLCGPAPRKLCVDVTDVATIGYRADGRLIALHCTPRTCELRDYRRDGQMKVLATLSGGRRHLACDDVGGFLKFSVDGEVIFELPRGRENWQPYRA